MKQERSSRGGFRKTVKWERSIYRAENFVENLSRMKDVGNLAKGLDR